MSSYIAYALFAVGVGLASLSPAFLLDPLKYVGGILLVMGVLCCLRTAFIQSRPLINSDLNIAMATRVFSKSKQIGMLLLGQSALLFISLALFYFLEMQTQINSRLHPMEMGYIVQVLQRHPFSLGLLPWLIYSILGIGLAYFSICLGKQPLLSRATLTKQKTKWSYFFQNMLSIITDVVTIGPYVFVLSFALVWFCETINTLFGWDPLFLTPFRTTFICSLIILVFQRSNKQLLAWMKQSQISVGKVFVIYIFAFTFFISWLHGFGAWFTLGHEVTTAGEVMKSALAGAYTEQSLHTRMSFLIWGWWSIWTPWMASLIARTSVGFTIIRALFHSILLPLLVFGWGLPHLASEYRGLIGGALLLPIVQISGVLGLLVFIWVVWGDQRTMGDVSKGAMLSIGRLSKRPLNRWMMMVTLWLTCYIPGWFMLGWLPLQVMVTLGGLFMMTVVAIFIGTWGASVFRLSVLKRYTPLESP